MAANPITMPESTVNTPALRDGRVRGSHPGGGSPFSEHLVQALEVRNSLPPSSIPMAKTKTNPFVEAVLTALKHAKAAGGTALTPSIGGVGDVDTREGLSPAQTDVLETALLQAQSSTNRPANARATTTGTQRSQVTQSSGGYEPIIKKASQRYGVDADLIRSVIKVESGFNPKAISPAGAMGMMQLMPATAKQLGVKNPFNAEENIMGGTAYLGRLLERYDGNIRSALAAYNWGPGNLERKSASAMPGETRNYITRVIGNVNDKTTV